MESLITGLTAGDVTVALTDNAYNVDRHLSYRGRAIELVETRPDLVRTDGNRCHLLLRLAN